MLQLCSVVLEEKHDSVMILDDSVMILGAFRYRVSSVDSPIEVERGRTSCKSEL